MGLAGCTETSVTG